MAVQRQKRPERDRDIEREIVKERERAQDIVPKGRALRTHSLQ
jgi:hypothetical protein